MYYKYFRSILLLISNSVIASAATVHVMLPKGLLSAASQARQKGVPLEDFLKETSVIHEATKVVTAPTAKAVSTAAHLSVEAGSHALANIAMLGQTTQSLVLLCTIGATVFTFHRLLFTIPAIKKDCEQLKGTCAEIDNKVSVVREDTKQIRKDCDDLKNSCDQIESDLKLVQENTSQIPDLLGKVNGLTNSLSDIKLHTEKIPGITSDVQSLITNMDALPRLLTKHDLGLRELLNDNVSKLKEEIGSVKGEISDLSSTVSTSLDKNATAVVTGVQTNVEKLLAKVDNELGDVKSIITTSFDGFTSTFEEQGENIYTLNRNIGTVHGSVVESMQHANDHSKKVGEGFRIFGSILHRFGAALNLDSSDVSESLETLVGFDIPTPTIKLETLRVVTRPFPSTPAHSPKIQSPPVKLDDDVQTDASFNTPGLLPVISSTLEAFGSRVLDDPIENEEVDLSYSPQSAIFSPSFHPKS